MNSGNGQLICSRFSLVAVVAILLVATASNAVHAQAYQCRAPAQISVPQVPREAPRRVPITGYTFAASWSPEFCKGRETQARHRSQCSGRNGRFGFIMHGLWPDGQRIWPQYCPTQRRVSPTQARRNFCMMPSARLQQHQWVKHGSCMTRDPATYFRISRIYWDFFRWPDMDRLSREEGLTAGRLREAFAARNDGWEPQHVGITLNSRGWFQEFRLCIGRDYMPARCSRRRYGPRDDVPVKVWRGL